MKKVKKLLAERDRINAMIKQEIGALFEEGQIVRVQRGKGVMVAEYVGTNSGRWSDEIRVRSRTGKIHHVHVGYVL